MTAQIKSATGIVAGSKGSFGRDISRAGAIGL